MGIAVDDCRRSDPRLQHFQCREVRFQREGERRIGGEVSRRRIRRSPDRQLRVGVETAAADAASRLPSMGPVSITIVSNGSDVSAPNERSPPSRRTFTAPFNRGAAASVQSPASVNVETNGNGAPASFATVATGTPEKAPRVVMRPSSHASAATSTLPSATLSRAAPTCTWSRANSKVAGAANRGGVGQAVQDGVADLLPPGGDRFGFAEFADAAMRGSFDIEIRARERQRRLVSRQRAVDVGACAGKLSLRRIDAGCRQFDL